MVLKYNDNGQPYEDMALENKKLQSRVAELDKSLSIALDINDNYQRDNKKLKEKVSAAEGETSIVKGIGLNSPEMKEKQKRIEYLEGKCRTAGRTMIELNMKYEANIKELDRLSEENTNLKVMLKGADGRNNNS